MKLIIVESPTKARTLSRFLGKGYFIEATMGHIKDLPKSTLGVDVEKNFKPEFSPVPKRLGTIKDIKALAKKANRIYLATDPDREGEAIASHVEEILSEKRVLKKGTLISRIVFHEITKEAVEEAIANPKKVDGNLVDAQIARRVLDRLVGYKLSPLLWRKVRRGLSAGRVQTVVVKLIVEREREIEAFKVQEYWEVYVKLQKGKTPKSQFTAQLVKVKIANRKEADEIVGNLKKAEYRVSDVRKRQIIKNPHPPFTTSTMTQAAARIFSWSARRTMTVAQKLYEEGLITYHRTDSTNIANQAVERLRKYIKDNYGKDYLPEVPRFYKTKSKVAQEAHEAVRPTDLEITKTKDDSKYAKDMETLYSLIWKRFVACQMASSVYDETIIDVEARSFTRQVKSANTWRVYFLRASGQIMKFDGWRKLFDTSRGGGIDSREVVLPEVEKDESLKFIGIDPQQKFTEPPARYNEASLIKTLEKLGIGRPSTYAPIISTIQLRNYVEKDEGAFKSTLVGIAVNDFLVGNFNEIFEYQFTAGMEENLDEVANGKVKWTKSIGAFWEPFEKILNKVTKNSKRVKIEVEKLGRKCPECKKGDLVIRIGRFGKFISCSNFPDCKHTEKLIQKIGIKCPDCNKGDVIIKNSKKGRKFFGCSRYPECKWASWRNPKVSPKIPTAGATSL